MNIKLPTEHHLEFLSLKAGCTGSSESTHVKMPHCLKSHVVAHICCYYRKLIYLNCRLLEVEDGSQLMEETIALSEVKDAPVVQGRILSPAGKRKLSYFLL